MRVQSATVDANNGIKGGFDLLSGQWEAKQNIQEKVKKIVLPQILLLLK